MAITTVAIDQAGHVVVRKALRRSQVVPFFAKLPGCLVDMTSLIRRAKATPTSVDPRLPTFLQRKSGRVVTVATADRTARVA